MKDGQAEILLVDAHGLILQGMRRVLERIPGVVVANAVTGVKEAGRLIATRTFDLYIIDIEYPDGSGFDLIKTIRHKDTFARIIVNTAHEQIWLMNRLMNCHVNSVVLKSSEIKDMEKAVLYSLKGETYHCSRFENLCRNLRSCLCPDKHKEDIPTLRELEVLKIIAQGFSTSQIASHLNISENTVETFRKRLMQKFSAKNSIDMVMKAISRGWISPESNDDK